MSELFDVDVDPALDSPNTQVRERVGPPEVPEAHNVTMELSRSDLLPEAPAVGVPYPWRSATALGGMFLAVGVIAAGVLYFGCGVS